MAAPRPPLFTRTFFTMCAFTFTVFLSAFQLLPVAPFHILALGGDTFAAGLFLGFLTYASAVSAPFTGALADRLGKRRMLIACSLVLSLFLAGYAFVPGYPLLLGLVLLQGVFWSGLLSASSAYMADVLPESRRAEGIGYWGLSTMLAVSVAPNVGFFFLARGWPTVCAVTALLNLGMAGIAWSLPKEPAARAPVPGAAPRRAGFVEWRVMALSMSLFLVSFGYGGITSFAALFAEQRGIAPKSLFFTAFAVTVLLTRPFAGRMADEVGHRRFAMPCFAIASAGLGLLALAESRAGLGLAAVVFGVGFGSLYPAFVAHVMRHTPPARRGAAFGGILAAFDVGIGTGSVTLGAVIQRHGFATAFGGAALLAALALPVFVALEKRLLPAAPSTPA
jgi:MFS family permease